MSPRNRAPRAPGVVVVVLVVCALGAGLLAACSGAARRPPRRAAAPTTTTAPAPPVAPLTGLPDPTGFARGHAALSVKIENTPDARPQSGVAQADVVYEEVVDGGIARLLAVFGSAAPAQVGPVRSVRPSDQEIVEPLGGIFVYSGGIPAEVQRIQSTPGLLALDETTAGGALFRIPSRAAPHNLYGSPPALWAHGGQPVPPPALFTYLPAGAPFGGVPATAVTVGLSPDRGYDPTYTWSPTLGGWARSYGAVPFVDADRSPVAPANVVLQFVSYLPQPGVFEAKATLVGQGDAWVFSAGEVVKGHWTRASASVPTRFVDLAGNPIRLTPGRTWVELAAFEDQTQVAGPPPPPAPVPAPPPAPAAP